MLILVNLTQQQNGVSAEHRTSITKICVCVPQEANPQALFSVIGQFVGEKVFWRWCICRGFKSLAKVNFLLRLKSKAGGERFTVNSTLEKKGAQRYIQTPVKHLRLSFFAIIGNGFQLYSQKSSIVDVRLGSKQASVTSIAQERGRLGIKNNADLEIVPERVGERGRVQSRGRVPSVMWR